MKSYDIIKHNGILYRVIFEDKKIGFITSINDVLDKTISIEQVGEISEATLEEKIGFIEKEYSVFEKKIIKTHIIGNYQIIEFSRKSSPQKTQFAIFIDFEDACISYTTLEQAIIGAIVYKFDGANSRATNYISRMIGLDKYEESKEVLEKF